MLKDYMCYHYDQPCCYKLFLALPIKISNTLRQFPKRRVTLDKDFEKFIVLLYKSLIEDKRIMNNVQYAVSIQKIENHEGSDKGGLESFLKFVVRVMIAREEINFRGKQDMINRTCIFCGKEYPELNNVKNFICDDCVQKLGLIIVDFHKEQKTAQPRKTPSPTIQGAFYFREHLKE
ncbi:MAG: hypothetical protein JXR73_03920 [Candidatus Omnitrophica bacterium]|nr:hypothetical protein [Candidatus Omnitrophota bacterium]